MKQYAKIINASKKEYQNIYNENEQLKKKTGKFEHYVKQQQQYEKKQQQQRLIQ